MALTPASDLVLYTFCRSSCSARLRIALNYKNIPARYAYVSLDSDEQFSDEYASLNPSKSVPTLVVHDHSAAAESIHPTAATGTTSTNTFPITQSLAALEYLEEAYPDAPKLLPASPVQRAKVRTLTTIVVADIQPVNSMRVSAHVKELGQDPKEWMEHWMSLGLDAFERVAKGTAGKYSVGDTISLADVALAPQCWNAGRVGLELGRWPTIARIFGELEKLDAVKKAHWSQQEDAKTS